MPRARPLTDHDDIRRWAEQRGARPARAEGAKQGEDGMICLGFPGRAIGDSPAEISWEEWFSAFDARGLALLVDGAEEGNPRPSNFNKLMPRDALAAEESSARTNGASPKPASRIVVAAAEDENERKRGRA